jgi:hypothetical protein
MKCATNWHQKIFEKHCRFFRILLQKRVTRSAPPTPIAIFIKASIGSFPLRHITRLHDATFLELHFNFTGKPKLQLKYFMSYSFAINFNINFFAVFPVFTDNWTNWFVCQNLASDFQSFQVHTIKTCVYLKWNIKLQTIC